MITIEWTPPENVALNPIVHYEITLTRVMAPNDSAVVVMTTGGALSAVAGGLSAFTEYSVAVRGCSPAGCGPFSPTIIQPTLEQG